MGGKYFVTFPSILYIKKLQTKNPKIALFNVTQPLFGSNPTVQESHDAAQIWIHPIEK